MEKQELTTDTKQSTKNKIFLKNILKVILSNVLVMISGILVGFLLPKIIGIIDYGYYKTFSLYITYVGLFHFGIEDGIYLIFSGKKFDELDKNKFRSYARLLILLELFLSILGITVSLFFIDSNLRFIFVCVSIYLFIINIINFYKLISQMTLRFTEFSLANIILSSLNGTFVLILYIISIFNGTNFTYQLYVFAFLCINFLILIWYFIRYRSITFGKCSKDGLKEDIITFIKIGFPLMLSNLCGTLILTIDRQFVNILFNKENYAIYAFAYNMLALITTATSAISVVLYPSLKKDDSEITASKYLKSMRIMLVISFVCLLVYFPLVGFVNWFLPKYIDSLEIFRIILPGIALQTPITIIMHNYYKLDKKSNLYFVISIVILGLSIGANFIAYYAFKTMISISVASIVVLLIWFFCCELYFIKKYKANTLINTFYMLIMVLSFYGITYIKNIYLGFAIYLLVLIIITYLLYFKQINSYISKKILNKNKGKQE